MMYNIRKIRRFKERGTGLCSLRSNVMQIAAVTVVVILGACDALCSAYEIDGYKYTYTIMDGGINLRPVLNTSSHNTDLAISPRPAGDFVISEYLPDSKTNFLPVVNIGYQPDWGRYAGSGHAISSGTMTGVVIPDTVTNIDVSAFADLCRTRNSPTAD